jgi:hypothetical protein
MWWRTAAQKSMIMLMIAGILNLGAGCSFLRSGTEMITINTTEPSAIIYVDSKKVGKGRVMVEMTRSQTHTIRVQLAHEPGGKIATIGQSMSWSGWIDTVLGYSGVFILVTLPWLLGAAAPGYWDLSPEEITIDPRAE